MKATINSNRRPALNIKHVESVLFKGDVFEFTFFFFYSFRFYSFRLCIAVNLHTSHCVQASYQDRFNLFHKRFWCDSEQSELNAVWLSSIDLTQSSKCVSTVEVRLIRFWEALPRSFIISLPAIWLSIVIDFCLKFVFELWFFFRNVESWSLSRRVHRQRSKY